MARILIAGALDFSRQDARDFVTALGVEVIEQGHVLLNGCRNQFDRLVAEIQSLQLSAGGNEVPTGAAAADQVERSEVAREVERFVEARREILQRRITTADIGVTDHTHRYLRRSELAAMTVSTRFVTGKAWRC